LRVASSKLETGSRPRREPTASLRA
jgi:hypothetical protein